MKEREPSYQMPDNLPDALEWHLNNGGFHSDADNLLADVCIVLLKRIERLEARVFEKEHDAAYAKMLDEGAGVPF